MEPIRVELDSKRGYMIVHRCTACGEIKRNRAATDAATQPDNLALVIKLTAGK